MKKSFLVTGLSNAIGGHEDGQIRNDLVREEIQEVLTEVIGDHIMGFKPSKDLSTDLFTSDSDSDFISEEDESRNTLITMLKTLKGNVIHLVMNLLTAFLGLTLSLMPILTYAYMYVQLSQFYLPIIYTRNFQPSF